jgi:mannitol-specific phosphotransferase system IIBC component
MTHLFFSIMNPKIPWVLLKPTYLFCDSLQGISGTLTYDRLTGAESQTTGPETLVLDIASTAAIVIYGD